MHIIDIMNDKKPINYYEEYNKLWCLYAGIGFDFEQTLDVRYIFKHIFLKFPDRGCLLDMLDYEKKFLPKNINPQGIFQVEKDELILFIEYLLHIISFIVKYISDVKTNDFSIINTYETIKENCSIIIQQIDNLLIEMNCVKIIQDKYVIIIESEDKKRIDLATDKNEKIIDVLYDYVSLTNKNDIETKRKLLNIVANDFENCKKEIEKYDKNLASDISYLLNSYNIRHNNVEENSKNYNGKIEHLSNSEFIEIYDNLFNMYLYAKAILNIKVKKEYVKELKIKYE